VNAAVPAILLVLAMASATAVVLTRNPGNQAIVYSAYGLILALLMVAFAAPDVALSQLGVGVALVPLVVMLTIARCRRETSPQGRRRRRGTGER
jgi:uncharacterized MnhB-related membrane protein